MDDYRDPLPWYKVPLKKCPICGKQFAPALEHAWLIGKKYSVIDTMDHRDIPVCTYTCMRKWEKEQEAKYNKSCRTEYSEEIIKSLPAVITDHVELKMAELYFRDRLKIKDIALDIGWSERVIARRIKKIKTILDNLEEQQ